MNELKKLLEANPDYPPTEAVWTQILALTLKKKEKPLKGLDKVRYSLLMETKAVESILSGGTKVEGAPDRARQPAPSLPEPQVVRFYHQDQVYYLDAKHQIYQPDPNHSLVGNLVGRIEEKNVIIGDQVVHKLPVKTVKEKEIHGRNYHLDFKLEAYRGLLPGQKYLWHVGKLNNKGKLELLV